MINLRVCVKIIKSYVNFLLLPPLRAKQSEAKLSNYSTNFVRVSLLIVTSPRATKTPISEMKNKISFHWQLDCFLLINDIRITQTVSLMCFFIV